MNIAVFYGGRSVEHEVSVLSAANIVDNIKKIDGFNPLCIFIDKEGKWFYTGNSIKTHSGGDEIFYDFSKRSFFTVSNRRIEVDVCFSVIHGNIGEDGSLAGFFNTADIPYTGCDLLSSAIAMNKKLSKTISSLNGVRVLSDIFLKKHEFDSEKVEKAVEKLGFPVFVKPNSLGSSVGVSKVKNKKELELALNKAFEYDSEVIIEKGVDRAREIVIGIIGDGKNNIISPAGEVRVKGNHEFYDYEAKYTDDNGMELIIPAQLDDKILSELRNQADIVFKSIGGYGFSRVDFLMDPLKCDFYFCEINTIPGFTSHSLFPRLFNHAGISVEKQIEMIIDLAFKRYNDRKKLRYEI